MTCSKARIVTALLMAFAGHQAMAQGTRPWVDPPADLSSPPPTAPAPVSPPAQVAPKPATPDRPVVRAEPPPAAASRTSRRETVEEETTRAAPARRQPRFAEPAARDRAPRRAAAEVAASRAAVPVRADPSFNCDYARSLVERMICAQPALAVRDRRMALLYEQAGGSRYRPVDSTQWRWLAARNACGRLPLNEVQACIAQVYDARIADLSEAAR